MTYTFYDPTTGEITGTGGGNGVDILSASHKDYIEGSYNPRFYYLDLATKTPVPKPRDPSHALKKYQFDWTNKIWQVDLATATQLVRDYRNQLLGDIDRVNPIWYDSLSVEQKQELQQYRQALLDVPQQVDFPESVTWPSKPSWL